MTLGADPKRSKSDRGKLISMDSSNTRDVDANLALKDAIERCAEYMRMNSYNYYRDQAAKRGAAYFGPTEVVIFKVGSRWMVRESHVLDALRATQRRDQDRQEATTAYVERRLSEAGGVIETNWGSYSVHGLFHRMTQRPPSSPVAVHTWRCNSCFGFTTNEQDREECHLCRDWSGCASDCTLSAIRCETCGTREAV